MFIKQNMMDFLIAFYKIVPSPLFQALQNSNQGLVLLPSSIIHISNRIFQENEPSYVPFRDMATTCVTRSCNRNILANSISSLDLNMNVADY